MKLVDADAAAADATWCFASRPADLDMLTRLTAARDDQPLAFRLLGQLLYHLGRRPDAMAAWQRAIELADDDPVTRRNLAVASHNIADDHPSMLEDLSLEEVIAADPDYIFVTTMGDEQKALDYLNGLIQQNPAWSELSAVKEDRYIVLPKDLFHYKPNNRWGESYQYLGEILYPELFHEE